MRKLTFRKKWFSLEDAAAYLADQFKENITWKDLVQISLEGDLRLSCVMRHRVARPIYSMCRTKWDPHFSLVVNIASPTKPEILERNRDLGKKTLDALRMLYSGECDPTEFHELPVQHELALAREARRCEIEKEAFNLFQKEQGQEVLTYGSEVYLDGPFRIVIEGAISDWLLSYVLGTDSELVSLDGWLVENHLGDLYQVLEPLDIPNGRTGSQEGSELIYIPSTSCPSVGELVIRVEDLLDFQTTNVEGDHLDSRERTTYMLLIGSLLEMLCPEDDPNLQQKSIVLELEDRYRGFSKRNLEKYFAAARKQVKENSRRPQ